MIVLLVIGVAALVCWASVVARRAVAQARRDLDALETDGFSEDDQ